MSSRNIQTWVEPLARTGYAAKGVVYTLIGALSFQIAIGSGGSASGAREALKTISEQTFGQILLLIVGLGLIAYALWRMTQSLLDPENEGTDLKGKVKRVGYFVSAITYTLLAVFALYIVLGKGGSQSTGGGGSKEITAEILAAPFGRWIVGIIGVAIIGAGIFQFIKGYKEKFKSRLKLWQMKASFRTWAVRSGKFGLIARSITYAIIGSFLIKAAWNYNPQEAGGIQKAFEELLSQPYGPWLLGVVTLGFIAYGIYMGILAKYRQIGTEG
jgi:hypothetical protein